MTFGNTGKTYRLSLNSIGDINALTIKGVIFDMDGTLTKPQTWMFGEMRSQLGVPKGVDILVHLESLPTAEDKKIAELKLRMIEERAMNEQEPTKGLVNLFTKLNEYGVNTSICTRNVPKPVTQFCKKFLNYDPFDLNDKTIIDSKRIITGPVITREFKPPKPSPKGLLHIISTWGLNPNEVIMVGDSNDDMDAGISAGCAVVLLRHDDNVHVEKSYLENKDDDNDDEAEYENVSKLNGVANDLDHLLEILEQGLTIRV